MTKRRIHSGNGKPRCLGRTNKKNISVSVEFIKSVSMALSDFMRRFARGMDAFNKAFNEEER